MPGFVPGLTHAGAQHRGFMSRKIEQPPPPGSPDAQKLGCVCSPNQNRNGAGVPGPGRVMYFALYWCPVHGIEKTMETVRRSEAELR